MYSFIQDAVIGFIAQISDKPALFSTQQITGTANIQVLHCNVEAAAQFRKGLDG